MAQPNTNSVLSAYEMLANAHAKRSDSMMIFANQIANNFNDIGKTAIAYHQAQKDNEFRQKVHNDDTKLKNRSLDIEEKSVNAKNALLYEQTRGQKYANTLPQTMHNAMTIKVNGEETIKPVVQQQANKLVEQGGIIKDNTYQGLEGMPIPQSPLTPTQSPQLQPIPNANTDNKTPLDKVLDKGKELWASFTSNNNNKIASR